ncbi:MAG: hypothetical protein A2186_03585 [Candidatus Levybacteria bacterium RIFOXYA1_FULL_41_10]|nr:MAG: hypothetical protein A3D82_03130 [Candidatus Levybacteria bacterium RIFCSPHIGHO2_02_FULL_40_29]OGH32108.1 MAG: hypothetical protein A3E70_01810 [Candidatus Levybacteria bacterium RIFCSPHIGHO2_12_FULL_40_44]OGH50954.1 MAG: hypothetical protein A3J18_02250 [Candidatus Levybacteria bacterium RIFCSPLOWO2_02_FULL_40_18]OGH53636.1 MAG: hypothetical protein A3H20_01005 [Candidatus Levybacteria bacterium RIFCSPLOWO2_12_FULL_41_12]OGH54385.1 MAG: hypothetical protein A2596_01535 [Candidatus Levy
MNERARPPLKIKDAGIPSQEIPNPQADIDHKVSKRDLIKEDRDDIIRSEGEGFGASHPQQSPEGPRL